MSKPRWQRALISFAGPAVNLLMPIVLLGGFFFLKGFPYPAYLDKPMVIQGLQKTSPLAKAGVSDGDRVVAINNVPTPTWSKADSLLAQVLPDAVLRFNIDRQGTQEVVEVKGAEFRSTDEPWGYLPVPPLVGQVSAGMPAKRAGLRRGDLIVSVNGTQLQAWQQFVDLIKLSKGETLKTAIKRNGEIVNLEIHPIQEKDERGQPVWRIGVGPGGEWAFRDMGFAASVKESSQETVEATGKLLGILGRLFSGKLSIRQFQSFVGIAVQAGQAVQEGPVDVINMMAMISLNLGILNLLPIPILDGGNLLLLSLEGIRRRDFSLAFKERFVQVGLVFLLALLAFVMYNDVVRLLPSHS